MIICTKPEQVKSWINNNKVQWEFWENVLRLETWCLEGKTKEQAIALANYYEGRYDMACDFNSILEESEK